MLRKQNKRGGFFPRKKQRSNRKKVIGLGLGSFLAAIFTGAFISKKERQP